MRLDPLPPHCHQVVAALGALGRPACPVDAVGPYWLTASTCLNVVLSTKAGR
jgi:hypothetical protein